MTSPPPPTSGGKWPVRSAIVAAAAAILAAGMLFGAALWIMAGIVVLTTIGVSYAVANHQDGAAVVTRSGGDVIVAVGSKIPVTVRVTNPTRWPIAWVLVEDISPVFATTSASAYAPPIQFDGQRLGVCWIPAGGHREWTYTVDCHRRGYMQLGPTVVETGDWLGLFRRFSVAGRPTYVTVLPTIETIDGYDIGSRRPIGEIRLRHRSMDDPTRIRGIRQWQIGDPMRSVHWAATARTGTLHTKLYEPSSIIGATIVLDMHTESNPAAGEPVRCDLAISAAASIAHHLMQSGEPFALVTGARDAADRLRQTPVRTASDKPDGGATAFRRRSRASTAGRMSGDNDRRRPIVIQPDKTPIHYRSMIQTLARLERSDALTLPELLTECESQIAADTTLLIILQTADESAIAAILSMARRGRAVEVIINTHDTESHARIAAPLDAAHIATHHLRDRPAIQTICRQLTP